MIAMRFKADLATHVDQQKTHQLEKLLAHRPEKTELVEKNVLKPGSVNALYIPKSKTHRIFMFYFCLNPTRRTEI